MYDVLLKHLWDRGHKQDVKDVLSDMRNRNIKPTAVGGAVLLAMYAQQKNRQKFREQYKDLMQRQLISQKIYSRVMQHLDAEQRAQFEEDIAMTLKKQNCVVST